METTDADEPRLGEPGAARRPYSTPLYLGGLGASRSPRASRFRSATLGGSRRRPLTASLDPSGFRLWEAGWAAAGSSAASPWRDIAIRQLRSSDLYLLADIVSEFAAVTRNGEIAMVERARLSTCRESGRDVILHNLAPGTAAPSPLISHANGALIFGGAMFPAMYNRPMQEQSVTLQILDHRVLGF